MDAEAATSTIMDYQLTLDKALMRAPRVAGEQEIVTRRPDGSMHRYTYSDFHRRARALASALIAAGLRPGERVASLMWNSYGHLEAYFGVPAAGGVLQTLNVRFHEDEIAYCVKHAGARFLIVDDTMLDVWTKACRQCEIERVFVFPFSGRPGNVAPHDDYESFIADAPDRELPGVQSETAPATLCYTGGTTGRPKGVVYSHRAIFLHALTEMTANAFGYGLNDVVLPAVPMYHVNGWGIPYSSVMAGARLVLPGPRLDPDSLLELCEGEGVTFMAGVPTLWWNLLNRLDQAPGAQLSGKLEIFTGGSAPHPSLISGLARHGISMIQGWGMTETSGIVTVSRLKPQLQSQPPETRYEYLAHQGMPVATADLRIVGPDGEDLPWDGKSAGEVHVRGASVTARYLNQSTQDKWTRDGWLRTGDVGLVDGLGYLKLLDRIEDLIKSGGEWIVPLEIENEILKHPGIIECAVVGVPDARWGERPFAALVLEKDGAFDERSLRGALRESFSKYWVPDRFIAVDAIPKTSLGKINRKKLRSDIAMTQTDKSEVE